MKHEPEARIVLMDDQSLFEAGRSQIKHAKGDCHRLKKEEKKTTSSFPLGANDGLSGGIEMTWLSVETTSVRTNSISAP